MTDEHLHDELARLRADFTAQQTQIIALQANQRDTASAAPRPHRHFPRRFLPLALVALLVILTPLATFAANPFTDLVPGSPHNANIDAIYNAGVTTGCVPNAQYCPADVVTRQEMASFLARLGGLGTNPPVANAKTVQGYAPNGLVRANKASFEGAVPITVANKIYGDVLTLSAPAAGYVLVTADLNLRWDSGAASATSRLHHVQGNTNSQRIFTSMSSVATYANATMTWTFPVAAGAQTFQISVDNNGGGFSAVAHTMTALYVPFDTNGTAPPAP